MQICHHAYEKGINHASLFIMPMKRTLPRQYIYLKCWENFPLILAPVPFIRYWDVRHC